jgi:hypothetical protein
MTTFEEFQNGATHNVDYGEIGKKIIELRDNDELWKWVETKNFSEFEKGIVVGFMTAWVEIFVEGNK